MLTKIKFAVGAGFVASLLHCAYFFLSAALIVPFVLYYGGADPHFKSFFDTSVIHHSFSVITVSLLIGAVHSLGVLVNIDGICHGKGCLEARTKRYVLYTAMAGYFDLYWKLALFGAILFGSLDGIVLSFTAILDVVTASMLRSASEKIALEIARAQGA